MPNEIEIRPMKFDDIDAVYGLELKLFASPGPRVFFENDLNLLATIAFVSTAQNKVIGYVLGSCVSDELHVQNIAVAEEWQRKGLAMQLMNGLEHEALSRNCRHFYLEVRPNNRSAIRLYEKLGYAVLYTRYHYYLDGDDAYVMTKELK